MKIEQYVEKSLVLAIGAGYDRIWRGLSVRLKKDKVTLLQAIVLISLFFEKQGEACVTPSGLARILKTGRANISHALSALERRGLLRRELDPRDARSYLLSLSPDGRKLAVRLIRVVDGMESFFERKFGKEHVFSTIASLREYGASCPSAVS